ncbi:MAG: restriction endonuclease subunit S [Thalassobium sp.]|nr:MAG: restriction endonuclease subunit S [Oceanospirillales bacterium]PHQ84268.1 MAG: restriction endonuclease subunit S [Thalassobium sp.]
MSNKHAVKEAPASYQSTPVPSVNRELQSFITSNPLTENINLWISATKAKSTSGRGSNKKIELVGIKKLRELILELAVRGKLVPQNPEDEPASELLKKIDAEKSKLVKEGKIKKQKPLPEITDEEKPFELPDGWEWVTADGVTLIQSGYAYKSPKFIQNGKNQVIRLGNVRPGLIRSNENPVYIDEDYASETSDFKLNSGDIVITMTGTKGKKDFLYSALIGNKHIDVFNLYLNQRLCRLRNILMNERYIVIALRSEQILNKVFSKSTGTANQANISLGAIREWPLPLPPLAEQHRIVAKVEELMTLCDQLEEHSEYQLDAHKQLVETLLATLVESKNADDLATNWQRLSEHFDTLFSGALTSTAGIGNGGGEWAIDRLKDTILQLAVMGKLVPQNPDDEPASELLKKIDAEKAKLVKEGKIKKQKLLPEVSEDEKPFVLPNGWEWIKLGNLLSLEYGDNLPSAKRSNTGEYPVYGSNGVVGTHNKALINEKCIVIGRKGSAGALNLCESSGCCVTDVAYFCIPHKSLYLKYIFQLLHTIGLDSLGKGIKPGLNRNEAYTLTIALPTLAEQQRIVAKVDELFSLCDQLKARLQAASETQLTLTEALVEQALR